MPTQIDRAVITLDVGGEARAARAETAEAIKTAGSSRSSQNSRDRPQQPRQPQQTKRRTAEPAVHQVRPRETLWSIAADRLGSAKRWREIAQLNYGSYPARRLVPDREALDPSRLDAPATDRISVGCVFSL